MISYRSFSFHCIQAKKLGEPDCSASGTIVMEVFRGDILIIDIYSGYKGSTGGMIDGRNDSRMTKYCTRVSITKMNANPDAHLRRNKISFECAVKGHTKCLIWMATYLYMPIKH